MSSIELVYFHSAPNLANHFSVFSPGFEKRLISRKPTMRRLPTPDSDFNLQDCAWGWNGLVSELAKAFQCNVAEQERCSLLYPASSVWKETWKEPRLVDTCEHCW